MVVLGLALLVHCALSVRLFPSWASLVDGERPVITVDHAIHLYHGALGARFAREHLTTWGYDPFFMAGYPETPIWDSSSNLAIAFELAAGGRYSPRAYKLGLFACTLLIVPLLVLGARGAGLSTRESAVTAIVGTAVFWLGVPATLWRTGLFAFVTASAASGAVLALLLRFDERPTRRRWLALLGAGALFLFAHVTAPVLLLGGALGYLGGVALRWRARRRRLAALLLAVLGAAGLNAFWLVPLWRFSAIRAPTFVFMTQDSFRAFLSLLLAKRLDGTIALTMILLGTGGILSWWREGRRLRAVVFGATATLFLALCSLGGSWSVTRVLEPVRFLASFDLILTIPAGSFLARGSSWIARMAGGGMRGAVAVSALAASIAAAAWLGAPKVVAVGADQMFGRHPLVVGLRPEDHALLDLIRAKTDPSARILFEDQLRLLETTDAESAHWTPLLPLLLAPDQRAFVGGLYHSAFIQHNHHASFGDFSLGGRYISLWTNRELSLYFEQYNIGWVICWSPLSRYTFDFLPGAHRIAEVPRAATPGREIMADENVFRAIATRGGQALAYKYLREGVNHYVLYRLDQPHSYFLSGQGKVRSMDDNRIELTDLAPSPQGDVVLSLHWLDTWRTDPPRPISPAHSPGDPIPFIGIKLDGPIPRLILYNHY